ncbi:MAG: AAA family ATPase [Phycisphaerae bacterium]|nr:AAA family ATPase [Phycisphaerae bacterium]NUQ46195.1 AAA family ATPase [Phycisphaerae bacterium]
MVERIRIENFRCFRELEVPLRPLTVLIGPNDTGKSVFLRAIGILSSSESGFMDSDHWRLDHTITTRIVGSVDGGEITFNAVRGTKSYTSSGHANPKALQPCRLYQLPSNGVSMEAPGQPDHVGPPSLMRTGEGVPTLLDYFLRRDRARFNSIVTSCRGFVPGLEEIEVATPDAPSRRLDLVIESDLRLKADEASAGVRMMLFFLALAWHPEPPKMILIEEPENGVHPKRLADVMRLLREITQGKHGGHAAQIILTTHSPYLLDLVDLNRDQVLVFRRNDDGSRTADPVDAERLAAFLDEFMLGEVWYNEGEAGLVGRSAS